MTPTHTRGDPAGERGAQALELAVATPLLLALVLLVVATAQVGVAAASTHRLAGLAARTAAVAHDDVVVAQMADLTGGSLGLRLDPPSGSRAIGDPVTAHVTRTITLLVLGTEVDLRGSATFRTEDTP